MISLITISCIAAAFAPVISKRMQANSISIVSTDSNLISDQCQNGGDKYGPDCELCTKNYCIKCNLSCKTNQYVNNKKCICVECKSEFGDTCQECSEEACKRCNSGYYLKGLDGKTYKTCQICGKTAGRDNICFDGITEQSPTYCENPPAGYICKGSKLVACSSVYSSICSRCNNSKCTSCGYGTHADSKGNCISCGISGCPWCQACDGKDTCNKCNSCDGGMLINNDTACKSCSQITTNCSKCDTRTGVCTGCGVGYYLTDKKQCQSCGISNCIYCEGGRSASSKVCAMCLPGYYRNGSNCSPCASKYGSNCVGCNESQCMSCAVEYTLSDNPASSSACQPTNGVWKCNDTNFMRIGNLCITRYAMGDVSIFPIPSSVHVEKAGGGYCYAGAGELCCWSSVGPCYGADGTYKGCRTRCTSAAAVEVCKNFKYAGLTWRLPTYDEALMWVKDGYGSQSALRLCDHNGALGTACGRPQGASGCKGLPTSIANDCDCNSYVTQDSGGGCGRVGLNPYYGNVLMGGRGGNDPTKLCSKTGSTYEVRCVTEMDD